MRTSKALAIAATLLAPAGLVLVQAGPSSAEVPPCGAITMNPDCHPVFAPPAQGSQPTFPYSSTMTVSTASVARPGTTPRVVQLPTDGSCEGQLASQCATPAEPASDLASAAAAPATSLNGLQPVASDRSVAADANHDKGLPMAPVAAAGTLLGGFAALTLFRRRRHSN
ncbi:MAG TPA: hypothetical protein VGJ14_07490 [Sporichthyaceae bacterium]